MELSKIIVIICKVIENKRAIFWSLLKMIPDICPKL